MQKLLTVKFIFSRGRGVANECLKGFKFIHNKSATVSLHNINTQNEIRYSKRSRPRKKAYCSLCEFKQVFVRRAVCTKRLSLLECPAAWQKNANRVMP